MQSAGTQVTKPGTGTSVYNKVYKQTLNDTLITTRCSTVPIDTEMVTNKLLTDVVTFLI